MRGLIVILSDVEKSTQLNELISLWNEIATNKYKIFIESTLVC